MNHASLIDGARLSGAQRLIYRHRDLEQLAGQLAQSRARRKLIVTDALFSMDGTLAPLAALTELAAQHGAWILLDEAHTGGVYGPGGAGYARALGLPLPELLMGTLSKAYGAVGGYVAARREVTDYLLNRARPFIFTTGLPPAAAAAALIHLLLAAEMEPQRAQLHARAAQLRSRLEAAGWNLAGSESQVIPLVAGEERAALALADRLRAAGILGVAIRPPTVAAGQARVRLTLTAAQRGEDLNHLCRVLGCGSL
ncbi:aminotransferase class I/II-fold pyridoxal phosphate-dependent enzyme [Deinococcus lacus]|uniref:8-amino-7-oxononanoate synthase n=1 Tax=Deinococcus lacus TaxID=392561 RepID=A0ABW1YIU6_9DEIO